MGQPVTTASAGICFAFPNVCLTTVPPPVNTVPIPYPSIGQLSAAERTDGAGVTVFAGGNPVVTRDFEIADTTGDAAGDSGVTSGVVGGKVTFTTASATVFAQEGGAVVRLGDTTSQNAGNAVGTVLGGFPLVLVGG